MSDLKTLPMWLEHAPGSPQCPHEECRYLRGGATALERCYFTTGCGGVVHAVESDWIDYDFGSGRGHVYFRRKCDKCGAEQSNLPKDEKP